MIGVIDGPLLAPILDNHGEQFEARVQESIRVEHARIVYSQ
jgi:hypothetical protein